MDREWILHRISVAFRHFDKLNAGLLNVRAE